LSVFSAGTLAKALYLWFTFRVIQDSFGTVGFILQDIVEAAEEMRRLYGPDAFAQASTRAAAAHLKNDEEAFEFWRAVALRLKSKGEN